MYEHCTAYTNCLFCIIQWYKCVIKMQPVHVQTLFYCKVTKFIHVCVFCREGRTTTTSRLVGYESD